MNSPLVSIIIPAYNAAQYVGSTLDSVTAQTYQNLEILVIDDGSTDNTMEMLNIYAKRDSRVRVIHKENGGVTKARLEGVAVATGEWIGFVDSDDAIEPDMYEILVSNALQYGADISHCGYQMVFPSRVDLYYGTGRLVEQDNLTGLKDLLDGSFIEPGLWNKLFRKTLFHTDVIDTSIKINEDLLMNFYLFREAGKSVFYDVCKYHYIVRAGSAATSKINENKLLDPIKVTKIMLEETREEPVLTQILRCRYLRQLISLATMQTTENEELIRPNRESARMKLKEELPKAMIDKTIDIRTKLKVLWAGLLPGCYGWTHALYLKMTGLDRIYEIS